MFIVIQLTLTGGIRVTIAVTNCKRMQLQKECVLYAGDVSSAPFKGSTMCPLMLLNTSSVRREEYSLGMVLSTKRIWEVKFSPN